MGVSDAMDADHENRWRLKRSRSHTLATSRLCVRLRRSSVGGGHDGAQQQKRRGRDGYDNLHFADH